jgi:uncharacterized protein (DUF1015 family)
MPQTAPLAALRYNLEHISSLSDVIAPPYDVIDPQLQDQLYKRHPANVIRVILNRPEPGDSGDERYARAAKFVEHWKQSGVLKRDEQPAYYVYHQQFEHEGKSFNRRGFMGRVWLQPFGEGNIYPHEETHPKAKVDRLKLTIATRQNNSQIFGLYPDPDNEVIGLLDEAAKAVKSFEAVDHLGVRHIVWPVTDPLVASRVSELMAPRPMFVADGHHRYETACNYRNQLIADSGGIEADHPANFVLTMLVGMSDPGMIVLPTHRLLRGTTRFSSGEIIHRLEGAMTCESVDGGLEAAAAVWSRMETADEQGWLGLYAVEDDRWLLCKATDGAKLRMRELAPEHSEDWRALGVSLLHRLVIDDLLGAKWHPKPTYVHDVSEVVEGLRGKSGHAESDSDEPYTLAALVMPAKLQHVEAISLNHERMPAKSTYFYPKLLSGLVFNPLT